MLLSRITPLNGIGQKKPTKLTFFVKIHFMLEVAACLTCRAKLRDSPLKGSGVEAFQNSSIYDSFFIKCPLNKCEECLEVQCHL